MVVKKKSGLLAGKREALACPSTGARSPKADMSVPSGRPDCRVGRQIRRECALGLQLSCAGADLLSPRAYNSLQLLLGNRS